MKGLNLHVPNIDLIKTSGEEEFDARLHAETRDHASRIDGFAADD